MLEIVLEALPDLFVAITVLLCRFCGKKTPEQIEARKKEKLKKLADKIDYLIEKGNTIKKE